MNTTMNRMGNVCAAPDLGYATLGDLYDAMGVEEEPNEETEEAIREAHEHPERLLRSDSLSSFFSELGI